MAFREHHVRADTVTDDGVERGGVLVEIDDATGEKRETELSDIETVRRLCAAGANGSRDRDAPSFDPGTDALKVYLCESWGVDIVEAFPDLRGSDLVKGSG